MSECKKADELWMYRYIVGMNCHYCNDNVLGVYGSIVGNERVSVRKKQQRKTKSVIYIIVKPCWLLWEGKKSLSYVHSEDRQHTVLYDFLCTVCNVRIRNIGFTQ